MPLTWDSLTDLDPSLADLDAEVRRRAVEKTGGSQMWWSALWYGTPGEPSVRRALNRLVGVGRGRPSDPSVLLQDPASPGRALQPVDTAALAEQILSKIASGTGGAEDELATEEAHDVATAYLGGLLRRELDRAPLPVLPPSGRALRGVPLDRHRTLLIDDLVAAAAVLADLDGDVLLVALAETSTQGGPRIIHALYNTDGTLISWDVPPSLRTGDHSSVQNLPDIDLEKVSEDNSDGADWRGGLQERVSRLNREWARHELSEAADGWLSPLTSYVHRLMTSHVGETPLFAHEGGERRVIGITPVVLPVCQECGASGYCTKSRMWWEHLDLL